jgi:hypothetical protein
MIQSFKYFTSCADCSKLTGLSNQGPKTESRPLAIADAGMAPACNYIAISLCACVLMMASFYPLCSSLVHSCCRIRTHCCGKKQRLARLASMPANAIQHRKSCVVEILPELHHEIPSATFSFFCRAPLKECSELGNKRR